MRSSARVTEPDAVVEEAVDARVVVVVELSEGLGVAAAGELDQRDQPGALGLVLERGGGERRVVGPRARGPPEAAGPSRLPAGARWSRSAATRSVAGPAPGPSGPPCRRAASSGPTSSARARRSASRPRSYARPTPRSTAAPRLGGRPTLPVGSDICDGTCRVLPCEPIRDARHALGDGRRPVGEQVYPRAAPRQRRGWRQFTLRRIAAPAATVPAAAPGDGGGEHAGAGRLAPGAVVADPPAVGAGVLAQPGVGVDRARVADQR